MKFVRALPTLVVWQSLKSSYFCGYALGEPLVNRKKRFIRPKTCVLALKLPLQETDFNRSLTTNGYKYLLLCIILFALSGCLGTKHLKGNERMLLRQSVQAPKNVNSEKLRELYVQRPNRRFLSVMPFHHLVMVYYWGERNYNREKYVKRKEEVEKKFDAKIAKARSQKKINNYQFRKQKKTERLQSFIDDGNQRMQWGEPIAVFDSAKVKLTEDRFREYLFAEGFLKNRVTSKVDTFAKFTTVAYKVDPGRPYLIDSIAYDIGDTAIVRLMSKNIRASIIKKGGRFRQDDLSAERDRIDLLLKDNGYYDFSRQYIDYSVDTAMLGDRKVLVLLMLHDPAKRGYHKRFTIDSVRFTTDASLSLQTRERESRSYRDITYSYYYDNYNLKILSQRVFTLPGNLYSRTKTQQTQERLANLDAFKFVNINYDTAGGHFITKIFTSPMDRYEWSNEVGVNVTQGYPGPFYSLNFKKRNIFKGLENLELNGRVGFEGVASATEDQNVYRSTEAGVNAALMFPQFIWPFREKTQFRLARYNPKTRLSLGYSYTDRPEYRRTSTTLSNTYTWQTGRNTQYSFALTNISLIDSDLTDEFQLLLEDLLAQGNYNLVRSFQPSFVSSMIFGVTWNRNYGSTEKNSVFIRSQVESGGTSLNIINPTIITDQDLQYFKYLRFSFDFRKTVILSRWATLAYRFNSGLAWAYSEGNALPYEKYFFVGGSNSVRAWRPRRLGQGSIPPAQSENKSGDGYFDYRIEKPGEILLEGSLELRSKIVGFIDGAVFLDAGNVWSFKPLNTEATVGNSQFKVDSFYKEFGVGTGFGLRFDFTFLILRFDVGMKIYDPARPDGDRFVLDKARFFGPYATQNADGSFSNIKEPVIYNLGIGYPF
jgi:outer membrane protein insertion porin family